MTSYVKCFLTRLTLAPWPMWQNIGLLWCYVITPKEPSQVQLLLVQLRRDVARVNAPLKFFRKETWLVMLIYGIWDLSSIQMPFMRNIEPPCRDKKIEHLCDVIFRSCVSILIYIKRCHPNCCQLQTSYFVKTPTLFSRMPFLNFARRSLERSLFLSLQWLVLFPLNLI